MDVKERIKYYEKALRLLEGKGIKKNRVRWTTPNWFKNESGICELLGILLNNFEKIGRCDIFLFPEFGVFQPTYQEQTEEEELVFWWNEDNRIARVIALTMCIEIV